MVAVNAQTGTLSAWWPMPYAEQAAVSLFNGSNQALTGGNAQITTVADPGEAAALGPQGQDGYFLPCHGQRPEHRLRAELPVPHGERLGQVRGGERVDAELRCSPELLPGRQ